MASQLTLDDCDFYHSMTLPTGEVRGQWDLRPRTPEYLGFVPFHGRSVLEVGPASGYLSFHMEAQGARVTAIEPPLDQLWDTVPMHGFDVEGWRTAFRPQIARIRNGFWYCHALHGSAVRVVETDAYAMPDDLGRFDVGLLACILLHTRAPFQLLEQVARRVDDTVIVVETHVPELGTQPICRLLPGIGEPQIHTWWHFTPQFFESALRVLGFSQAVTTFHLQKSEAVGCEVPMFTVVARR